MSDGIVDLHNHLIPGVDDGATDVEESLAALQHLVSEGVRALATTPHVDASTLGRPAAWKARRNELDEGWALLEACAADVTGIEVHRGVELKLDDPAPDLSDACVRIAGGRFVLVEFPYFVVPPRSTHVLAHLEREGYTAIIAHPERYAGISDDEDLIDRWRAAGAILQVNGGSLLGRYGSTARAMAFRLLERGWVDYLSSDYHARGRSEIVAYARTVETLAGARHRELLTRENPARILRSEDPVDVPELDAASGFRERMAQLG